MTLLFRKYDFICPNKITELNKQLLYKRALPVKIIYGGPMFFEAPLK